MLPETHEVMVANNDDSKTRGYYNYLKKYKLRKINSKSHQLSVGGGRQGKKTKMM